MAYENKGLERNLSEDPLANAAQAAMSLLKQNIGSYSGKEKKAWNEALVKFSDALRDYVSKGGDIASIAKDANGKLTHAGLLIGEENIDKLSKKADESDEAYSSRMKGIYKQQRKCLNKLYNNSHPKPWQETAKTAGQAILIALLILLLLAIIFAAILVSHGTALTAIPGVFKAKLFSGIATLKAGELSALKWEEVGALAAVAVGLASAGAYVALKGDKSEKNAEEDQDIEGGKALKTEDQDTVAQNPDGSSSQVAPAPTRASSQRGPVVGSGESVVRGDAAAAKNPEPASKADHLNNNIIWGKPAETDLNNQNIKFGQYSFAVQQGGEPQVKVTVATDKDGNVVSVGVTGGTNQQKAEFVKKVLGQLDVNDEQKRAIVSSCNPSSVAPSQATPAAS